MALFLFEHFTNISNIVGIEEHGADTYTVIDHLLLPGGAAPVSILLKDISNIVGIEEHDADTYTVIDHLLLPGGAAPVSILLKDISNIGVHE